MTARHGIPFELGLRRRLRGARRIAVIGIGDESERSDRLGAVAAKEIEAMGLPDVQVFVAGAVPEELSQAIRRAKPDHVILLSSAALGARPGTAFIVRPEGRPGSLFFLPAPLIAFMERLERAAKTRVTLVALQADVRRREEGLTPAEEAGLAHLLTTLQRILADRPGGTRGTYGKERRSK